MLISLVVSGIGAVVAAIGGGVLLAQCFREPRGDIIAWSVALLGLLISLGAQAVGYLGGFDGAMFRAVELGGQVIAPLALILALSEVAARSTAVRFCARLYIPALAIVAAVILTLDQLAQATFTKVWPDPAVFYQTPPNYILEFAVGPLTALVAIIAVGVVAYRSGQPGWNALLPAQLMGGAAALLLAYPALAQLVAYMTGVHLPVASVFAALCTAAAVLTWLAGTRTGRLRLAGLHGRATRSDDWNYARPSADHEDRAPHDFGRFEPATDGGVYRGGGLYRPDPPGGTERERDDAGNGWRDDSGYDDWRDSGDPGAGGAHWRSAQRDGGYQSPGFATGDFVAGDYATGDFATGDFAPGDDRGADASDWQSRAGTGDRHDQRDPRQFADEMDGRPGWQAGPAEERDRFAGRAGQAGDDASRTQLFGQIAIYTLLEDRVEEFDQLTQGIVDLVRSSEPDTLVFIVHAVPSAPMQRILYEVYRDRDAYQWHTEQAHVQQFEADKRPYVLATNVIELGLQQAKVSPFPSVAELFSEPGYDTAGFERPDYLRDYGRTSAQPGGGTREYR
jgi:quinol monooxygenase YgiN